MYSLYKNEYKIFKKQQKKRAKVERKKTGDEPIQVIIYIYTHKCHKETPCVAT
jgi:hypothetical protein